MTRYSKASEMVLCDICGKRMHARGYGNHLLQTHKMKLTQVMEKRKPHVSEKPPHVSEKPPHVSEKLPHVSEKPITVVKKEIITTKRVYVPSYWADRLPNISNAPDPLSENPVEAKRGRLFFENLKKKYGNK